MTSRRRARQHRHAGTDRRGRAAAREAPPTSSWGKEHDTVGVMVGWCSGTDPAALKEAQQATHDAVLAQLGDDRTGPVTWRIYQGDEATTVLDKLGAYPDDELPHPDLDEWQATVIRPIRGRLREYGGLLVVATAPGITPS